MENLIFKYKGWSWIKRIIGVFWIFIGVAELFFSGDPLRLMDWIKSIGFVLLGVLWFTPLVGNSETKLVVGDGILKIKWRTKIREIIIMENEIEKILLKNNLIEIRRKEKNPVVLIFEKFKLEDKTKVYEFMIEYARQKNIVLEK
jgi:hypothetical protein